jgi:all-trans-retinol dehydrogenase (NAD+)
MSSLAHRRILVTGAGRGLGNEIARQLLRLQAEVIVTDRDANRLAEAVKDLGSGGGSVFGYELDVTDGEAVLKFRDRLHREHGPLDGVVNNAGIVHGGAFLSVPVESHLQTVDINLSGVIRVTHAFLPDLIARPESYLVNLISASAIIPLPMGSSYAASKWAGLGFTESLREELKMLGHRHVRVIAVCPSYIATGLFDGAKPAAGTWMLTPETVAAKVIRSMEKYRQVVLVPWTVRLLVIAKGWLPRRAYYWFLRRIGVNTSMKEWHGRQAAAVEPP